MEIEIKLLNAKAQLPEYSTSGSAGLDISSCLDETIILNHGEVKMIPTGISIAVPPGFECQVRSRSGLAAKNGVFALNSPGTIDSDYRGEVKVILANFGNDPFEIKNGMRIAQLVIAKYEHINWNVVEDLSETVRGDGGFGSTGVH
jgi:dUTP pyrophosphatase